MKFGDTLVVESEGVVGVACTNAFAVSAEQGEFYDFTWDDPVTDPKVLLILGNSIRAAVMEAKRLGFAIKPAFEVFAANRAENVVTTVQIIYENGKPLNLPPGATALMLYGMDGEYAEGPVLGGWDSTLGIWSDDSGGELEWMPLYFAVPPENPCRSFTAPTVGNEVV